jgi:hypothetical protein
MSFTAMRQLLTTSASRTARAGLLRVSEWCQLVFTREREREREEEGESVCVRKCVSIASHSSAGDTYS